MPKVGLRETFDLKTRNDYRKVTCEIGVSIDGRELPNMSVLGFALEEAIALFQAKITESYKVVPARVGTTEISQPYGLKPESPDPQLKPIELT
jgi:hypothetical protein